ncbi:hypothetical protein H3H54_13400 [Brachybacterium sp. Z12]|uniref:hypothetical protein n=1 Tax=Brachybacterium sp. Z12 TaxID=2759167 RepID=UPI00185FD55D|nr:hypothetical protein [Brachybacterium sp. Z12]QNN82141.1 hypothetical protein H3H54_13400 [Brachybacterium sp. Z12]
MDNVTATQPDGAVRARITQGTQQVVGPLLIGVMSAHVDPTAPDGSRPPQVRLEVLTHREIGIPSPGMVGLDTGESLLLEGLGVLELVHVADPPGRADAAPSGSGERAVVFLELRPS